MKTLFRVGRPHGPQSAQIAPVFAQTSAHRRITFEHGGTMWNLVRLLRLRAEEDSGTAEATGNVLTSPAVYRPYEAP
jgi:hypothetical protein